MLLLSASSYGQSKKSKLWKQSANSDKQLAFNAFYGLASEYGNGRVNFDSLQFYTNLAEEYTKNYATLKTPTNKGKVLFLKGLYFQRKGNNYRSLNYFTQCFEVIPKDSIHPSYYFYMGYVNKKLGNYDQAVQNYQIASRIYEKRKDDKSVANIYINLANILNQVNRHKGALDYLNKALVVASRDSMKTSLPKIYNNMGNVYLDLKNYDLALAHYQKAYDNVVALNYPKGEFLSLVNLADAKMKLGNKQGAISNLQEALTITKKINNDSYLQKAYYEIGNYFSAVGDERRAKLYLGQAEVIADSLNQKPDLKMIYLSYRNLYQKKGKYKLAYDYYAKYEAVKDTVISRENNLKVTQLTAEFESEKEKQRSAKLEQEKILLKEKSEKERLENERLKAMNEKDKILKYLLGSICLLFLGLSATGFWLFRLKQKKSNELEMINITLEEKQEEITQQRDALDEANQNLEQINVELIGKHNEIELQKEEIRAQRDLVSNINTELTKRNKDVTDSIHYAQKIQQAMLNSSFELEQSQFEHFIFYKPRDIVSGDFYWSHIVDDQLILAVGDCTGHGVPGAFMSCLGISLLNEIVFERKLNQPNKILEELRTSVIKLISAKKADNEVQIGDGMDIAIININLKSKKMLFSGAMNGLKIYRDGAAVEMKGDKSPIGLHIIPDHEFSLTEYQLEKDDCVYLSTDGYKDQFGGPKGKKFGNRQLTGLIESIGEKPIPKQYTEIISNYKLWKKMEEQIDDVCLLGLRIS